MDFKKGLVSCVTPVLNEERFLDRMISSVLNQSYPQIEFILVDDGSTDRTAEIAESYRGRFAQRGYEYHIVHTKHKSASAAINCGLPLVKGEYLIWPDGDDVLEPDSVKKRVDFLESHPEYSCVRSLMYYFDGDGNSISPYENMGDPEKEDLFFDILEGKTFVCCGCYMLRSEELFSIYPQRHIPEYSVGQNFQMLLPFMYRHLCPTLSEKLYGVCRHQGNHSGQILTDAEERQKYRDFELLIDEISSICKINNFLEKRKLLCWKLERRKELAKRQGRGLDEKIASAELFLLGKSRLHNVLFPWLIQVFQRKTTSIRKKDLAAAYFRLDKN